MSIEEYLLDTGKSLENKMTDFEKQCYGMPESEIRRQYMNSFTAKMAGTEMVVMGILSDCQELMVAKNHDYPNGGPNRYDEQIRKQLNVAKFILSEMMDEKRNATA